MIAARLLMPTTVLGVDLAGSGATWAGWEAAGHNGLSPALSVLLLAAPVGLVAAYWLPEWQARRVGHELGVRAIAPGAPELWQRVRRLILDPHTSLTTGRLVVTGVQAVDPDHDRNLRWFAGALAHSYDDPVGHAVAKLAVRGRVTDVVQAPGLGIRGWVDQHPVRVGEPEWIGHDQAQEQAQVGTTVAVEVDQRPLGRITLAEEVRADAAGQLGRLRSIGVTPVLASPSSEEAVARLARLSTSPAWQSETDPIRLAQELAITGEAAGLVRVEADGSVTLVVVECDPPGLVQHRRTTSLTGATVDCLAHALTLIFSVGRARRRAVISTGVLMLLAVPFAVLGFVPPVAALAIAGLSWLAVAAIALGGFPKNLGSEDPEA
ncbi:HAD family hydrolase [Nocardioides sp. W7]|uniref:HAD family hydrolase n=1 Tax=Nocardioides sp. W7 TaxID=2931390 RepID=UPI001FD36B94|nr:HAD family hydrolase [Nocardioides sp. W7]